MRKLRKRNVEFIDIGAECHRQGGMPGIQGSLRYRTPVGRFDLSCYHIRSDWSDEIYCVGKTCSFQKLLFIRVICDTVYEILVLEYAVPWHELFETVCQPERIFIFRLHVRLYRKESQIPGRRLRNRYIIIAIFLAVDHVENGIFLDIELQRIPPAGNGSRVPGWIWK